MVSRKLQGLGRQADRVRGQFASLLGAGGIALALAGITRVVAGFEQTMSTVQGITNATGSEFEDLTAIAEKLGATTRFTAQQAGEGLLFLARAGFTVAESIDTVDDTLKLAQAGALDLGTAADIASNVLKGFRLETDQASRVVDVLALAANSANTNVGQLGQGLKFVAPVAAGLGVEIEETSAAIAALSNAGLQGTLAGTGLRRVLAELESPSEKTREILAKAGVSAEQFEVSSVGLTQALTVLRKAGVDTGQALEIFGQRGGPAFEVLSTSIPDIERFTASFLKAEGTADRIATIMDDNLNGALLRVKSAAEAVVLAFAKFGGSGFLRGFFEGLAASLRGFARNMDTVLKLMKVLVITLTVAFAQRAVALAVAGFNAITASVVRLTAAIAANPLGALAVAITAIGTLLFVFRDRIKLTNEGMATFGDLVTEAAFLLSGIFADSIVFVEESVKSLGQLFGGIFDDFDISLASALRGLARLADFITNSVTAPFRLVATLAKFLPKALEEAFVVGLNAVLRATEFGVNKIITALNQIPGVDIEVFDVELLTNNAKGAGRVLAGALLGEVEATFGAGAASEAVEGLLASAEARARERLTQAAPLNQPTATFAGQGEAAPAAAAPGGIATDLQVILTQLEQQKALLRLTNSERQIANELLSIEEELVRKLTDTETALVVTQLEQLQALQTQANILDELRGPQEELVMRQEALNELYRAGTISLTEFNDEMLVLAQRSAEADNSIRGGLAAGLLEIANRTQQVGKNVQQFVVGAFDSATDAIVNFATTGKFEFRAFVADLLQQLAKLALQLAITAALKAALGGGAGGGLLGTVLGGVTGSAAPGAQNGADFTIGGSGGTDSQLVQFRGTPGERVQVTTPGQQSNSSQPVVVQAPPVNITNVQSVDDIPLGIESAEGEQAVLNVLSRNTEAIKALTG